MATASLSGTVVGSEAPPASPSDEAMVLRTVEEYRDAYQARDIDRMLASFADDAELTLAPGTFRGKDAIRRVLEWDARLSPTASVRDVGVGVVVSGRKAVWERAISLTYEGIPYEEEATLVLELDDAGRIVRFRSYYDKLDVMERIAAGYPGLQGRIFRALIGYLVAQGRKGLDVAAR
jgi:ketosteroid isomerase-like protein